MNDTASSQPEQPCRCDTGNDPALTVVIAALLAMPPKQRNALVQLMNILLDLPWPSLAALAKAADPDLPDHTVAILAGVCKRHLLRNEVYQRIKQNGADFLLTLPRPDRTKTKRHNRRPMHNPGEDAGADGFSDPDHCDS